VEQQIQVPTHGNRLFPTWIGFRCVIVPRSSIATGSPRRPWHLPGCPPAQTANLTPMIDGYLPDASTRTTDISLPTASPVADSSALCPHASRGRYRSPGSSCSITPLFNSSIGGGRFKSTPVSLRRRESWLFLMGRPSLSSR